MKRGVAALKSPPSLRGGGRINFSGEKFMKRGVAALKSPPCFAAVLDKFFWGKIYETRPCRS